MYEPSRYVRDMNHLQAASVDDGASWSIEISASRRWSLGRHTATAPPKGGGVVSLLPVDSSFAENKICEKKLPCHGQRKPPRRHAKEADETGAHGQGVHAVVAQCRKSQLSADARAYCGC